MHGLVIPYCRYHCLHNIKYLFLLPIMLQTETELYLQILQDSVKIRLGVFVYCFHDS